MIASQNDSRPPVLQGRRPRAITDDDTAYIETLFYEPLMKQHTNTEVLRIIHEENLTVDSET